MRRYLSIVLLLLPVLVGTQACIVPILGHRPKGTSRPLEAALSGSPLDGRPMLKKRRLLAPEFVAVRMRDRDPRAFHFAF